jgi:ankyrin repeat protein
MHGCQANITQASTCQTAPVHKLQEDLIFFSGLSCTLARAASILTTAPTHTSNCSMPRKSSKKKKEVPPPTTVAIHRTPQLSALLQAAGSGNVVAVQQYLAGGGRPEAATTFKAAGHTFTAPLLIAATIQHHGTSQGSMQLLLDAGAGLDVDFITPNGETCTALMMASSSDCCTAPMQLLLQHGANPCAQAINEGCKALQLSALRGNPAKCTLLLNATGGERALHLQDSYSWTPIYSAASRGRVEVVKLLHERGAKTDFVDKDGDSLEHIATQYPPVLQYVLAHCSNNLNTANKQAAHRCTQLLLSVLWTLCDCCWLLGLTSALLELKVARAQVRAHYYAKLTLPNHETAVLLSVAILSRPCAVTSCYCTSFATATIAVQRGHTAVLELLLAHDSQATLAATFGGLSLLHIAVMSEELSCARLLLQHGADVHAVNALTQQLSLQNTPLFCSVCDDSQGGAEMTAMLLQHGAAVNARAANGATPLSAAVAFSSAESVQVLLSAGADVTAQHANGVTVLHAAAGNSKHPEVLQLLLEQSSASAMIGNLAVVCDCCGARTAFMSCEQPAHLKLLLAAGADVHTTTDRSNTALHVAAVHKFAAPVLCLLIKAGVDLHAVNNDGKTAAQVAADSGNTLAAALLTRSARDF